MNWQQIAGKWKELKGNVQQKWGKLTDDDFEQIDGRRVALIGKIQSRYGLAKEDAERQVDDWLERVN